MNSCISLQQRYKQGIKKRGGKNLSNKQLRQKIRSYKAGWSQQIRNNYQETVRSTKNLHVKEYIAFRTDLKNQYHEAFLFLKLILVLGLLILAIRVRYVNFIKRFPRHFFYEIVAYIASSLFCYFFFLFFRGLKVSGKDMFRQISILIFFVVFVVFCAELGSLEASLSERAGDKTPYEKKQKEAKELLPAHILDVLTIILIVGLGFTLVQSVLQKPKLSFGKLWNTSFYFRYFIIFSMLALLFMVLFYTTPVSNWVKKKLNLQISTWNLSLGVFAGFAYISIFLYILYMSIFRVSSINLFTYGARNPSFWSGKSPMASNIIRISFFLVESIVITIFTAIPLFLVAYYRNPEEKRKIFKNKEILTEFFLLCLKVFLFYVILQLTGGFDWTNKGYCMDKKFHNIAET